MLVETFDFNKKTDSRVWPTLWSAVNIPLQKKWAAKRRSEVCCLVIKHYFTCWEFSFLLLFRFSVAVDSTWNISMKSLKLKPLKDGRSRLNSFANLDFLVLFCCFGLTLMHSLADLRLNNVPILLTIRTIDLISTSWRRKCFAASCSHYSDRRNWCWSTIELRLLST